MKVERDHLGIILNLAEARRKDLMRLLVHRVQTRPCHVNVSCETT